MKDGWELFNPTLSQSRLGSHGDNEAGGDSNSDKGLECGQMATVTVSGDC